MKKVRRVPRKIGGDEDGDGDNPTIQPSNQGKHCYPHLISTNV